MYVGILSERIQDILYGLKHSIHSLLKLGMTTNSSRLGGSRIERPYFLLQINWFTSFIQDFGSIRMGPTCIFHTRLSKVVTSKVFSDRCRCVCIQWTECFISELSRINILNNTDTVQNTFKIIPLRSTDTMGQWKAALCRSKLKAYYENGMGYVQVFRGLKIEIDNLKIRKDPITFTECNMSLDL